MISTTFHHTIHHEPFHFKVKIKLFVDNKVTMSKNNKFIYLFFLQEKQRNKIKAGTPQYKEREKYPVAGGRVIC